MYNCTLVAHLQWCTPHEMLKGEMPNIDHLCVFGCGALVYLPASARANKMAPKLELMTYISVAPGNEHNFLFMRSTNTVFTTAHTIFDECHFPHCPKNRPEAPEAPEEEPNQINPPCTPSPVPPPASRMPSPARNLPPLALKHPGRAEHCQNAPCPPAVNIPACPQCECRAPLHLSVSQSVDLGQSNNQNTTPTKDYEIVRVVVYLRGVQRGYAEEGERGSTPTG